MEKMIHKSQANPHVSYPTRWFQGGGCGLMESRRSPFRGLLRTTFPISPVDSAKATGGSFIRCSSTPKRVNMRLFFNKSELLTSC